jgi:exodeoxyribonuclease VII large subunit
MFGMDITNEAEGFPHNVPEFSVGQISTALQRTVEGAFARVRVRGEVSGFKRAASGHLYFALKDADALLDAACWKQQANRVKILPEDGMEVIATGRISTFPGRSKYQLIVETIELAGAGALLALIEERKRKLSAEGLFAPERKRALPYLPEVIGIVTSPTGAVIRDILHRLADRFPRHVLVWPVLVQGEGAAAQVTAAIQGFNAIEPGGAVPRPDLLIVARGGGSVEDLMAFNEEIVVRAAAMSAIPLISAVGHETDTTLIDFASDRRAPTPTAAAEIAVPVRADLRRRVEEGHTRLRIALERLVETRRIEIAGLQRGLGDPVSLLAQAAQRLDDRSERFQRSWTVFRDRRAGDVATLAARLPTPHMQLGFAKRRADSAARALDIAMTGAKRSAQARLDHQRLDLARLGQLLETLHKGALERGPVQVRDKLGKVIVSAAEIQPGQALDLVFADGAVGVTADGKKPKRDQPAVVQGSLL